MKTLVAVLTASASLLPTGQLPTQQPKFQELNPAVILPVEKRPEFPDRSGEREAARLAKIKSDCDAKGGTLDGETCVIPTPPVVPPAAVYQAAPVAVPSGNLYTACQCTWFVASVRSVPGHWGNAGQWAYNARASGWKTGNHPTIGSIWVSYESWIGHVAIVRAVAGNQMLVQDMNGPGGYCGIATYWTPIRGEFIY